MPRQATLHAPALGIHAQRVMSGRRCGGHGRTMRRQPQSTEHLRSWNEGAAKAAITSFVRSVTARGEGFVPPGERIATFDNHGPRRFETPTDPPAGVGVTRVR